MPATTPAFQNTSSGLFFHHHQHSMPAFHPQHPQTPKPELMVSSRKRKCAYDEDESDMHMDDMMLMSPNSPGAATSPTTYTHVAKRQQHGFGGGVKRVMYSGADSTSAVLQSLAQQQSGDAIVECPRAGSHPAASMLASPWCIPVYNTAAVQQSCDADGMDIDRPITPQKPVVRVTGICGV